MTHVIGLTPQKNIDGRGKLNKIAPAALEIIGVNSAIAARTSLAHDTPMQGFPKVYKYHESSV
jgi:hypothetical protein